MRLQRAQRAHHVDRRRGSGRRGWRRAARGVVSAAAAGGLLVAPPAVGAAHASGVPGWPTTVAVVSTGTGYLEVTDAGNVLNEHTAFYGSMAGQALPAPVVGAAVDPATGGYWLVTEAGNVYNFHAPWYGSLAGRSLSSPVVAMTATATGYLVTTAAGNVYNFHTPWYGSKAGAALPASVTAITVDPYTGGYWLATTGGNVYNFHAPWYGSAVGKGHADVSGIVGTPTGYLLTTTAGNVYNFHTPFHGSLANRSLTAPITGITADPAVHGSYWLAAATGAVYPFAAPDYGRAHTRTIAACNGTELLVTAGSTGAVLGHDGDYLSFTNTGSQPCSLTGYPGVAALGANGQQILQATRTPNGHLGGLRPGNTIAPTVILARHETATAVVETQDIRVGNDQCHAVAGLEVTPPNTATSTRITQAAPPRGVPSRPIPPMPTECGGIQIHPVLANATGTQQP